MLLILFFLLYIFAYLSTIYKFYNFFIFLLINLIVIYQIFRNPLKRSYNLFLILFFFLLFTIVPNYWFSDDSIRHIYDAYYFLNHIDPFMVSPLQGGNVPGMTLYPNHPHFTTIYFPFTQFVALISSYIAHLIYYISNIPLYELCFRICFYMLEFFFIYWILKKNPSYISFFLTPIFLIESASCHTDVHGVLILILVLSAKSFYVSGIFLPFLLFIKPEGWIIYFNFFLGILYRLVQAKLYKKVYLFLFINFVSISLFMFTLYVYYLQGYISLKTFHGFLKQANIYNNIFLAYQPFILMIQYIFDWDSILSIQYYKQHLKFIIILILILFYFIWVRNYKTFNLKTKEFFYRLILLQLVLYFLYKASWQPWYFLWFFPFLWQLKYLEFINVFSAILILWYIPVIYLHVKGNYEYEVFFLSIFVSLIFYFFKIYSTKNKKTMF